MARKAFIEYQEALDGFTKIRKEMNGYIDDGKIEEAKNMFNALKYYAANEEPIAMDVLAYYYKTGIKDVVKENYMKYIKWELIAAARGNELAIEKVQFLIGYACDQIVDSDDYDEIAYKNDIDEYNILYVIGKNLSKILVKDYLKAFPIDLIQEEDEGKPFNQEDFIILRKMIDEAVPKTIEFMK